MSLSIAEALKQTNWNVEETVALTGAGRHSIVTKLGKMRARGQAPRGLSAVEANNVRRGFPPGGIKQQEAEAAAKQGTEIDLQQDHGVITTRSRNIRTLEAALKEAKVDLKVWEVERHVVNSWEVTMGRSGTGTGKPATFTNFQVKVWLRRIKKTALATSIEQLIATGIKPVTLKSLPKLAAKRKSMLEISLYDQHFGMYAYGAETGESYDLKIAEQRYLYAVQDLLNKTSGFSPEQIVVPLGQDLFHLNDPTNETPHGHNKLDVDTRLAKVVETAERAVIAAIHMCAERAPVRVLHVPGNHDPQTSYYLARIIAAYFRNETRVTVDTSPKCRKYVRFGASLIGYTHGNEETHSSLPGIMAAECPDDFGKVTTREFHLGHFHKRKETRYNAADTFNGVVVRVLPSLCATDAWHFKKGYVGGNRAADAYLFDKDEGFIGSFTSWAKQ